MRPRKTRGLTGRWGTGFAGRSGGLDIGMSSYGDWFRAGREVAGSATIVCRTPMGWSFVPGTWNGVRDVSRWLREPSGALLGKTLSFQISLPPFRMVWRSFPMSLPAFPMTFCSFPMSLWSFRMKLNSFRKTLWAIRMPFCSFPTPGDAEEVSGDRYEVIGDGEELIGNRRKVSGGTEKVSGETESLPGETQNVIGGTEEVSGGTLGLTGSPHKASLGRGIAIG